MFATFDGLQKFNYFLSLGESRGSTKQNFINHDFMLTLILNKKLSDELRAEFFREHRMQSFLFLTENKFYFLTFLLLLSFFEVE